MKDEQLENMVVTLYHGHGWSIRRIARELGVSRKRIRRVLVSKKVLRDTTPQGRIGPKNEGQVSLIRTRSILVRYWKNTRVSQRSGSLS